MPSKRILVIDDDRTILDILELTLRRAGFEVLIASHGDIGLRLFREERPDLALVDIAMPGLDGFDVIERIRATEGEAGQIPIMILTAHEQAVMRSYAADLNVQLYQTKPVTPAQLVQSIQELLGGPPPGGESAGG